jgi:O-antigen/teichoic acid export membrane protein
MVSKQRFKIALLFAQTPRGRMTRGVLANVYDKGAVTLLQLISLTYLSREWGAEGYGIWLMMMTLPTYIALSDIGLGTAASTAIAQYVASGDFDAALAALHSTTAFILAAVALPCLAALSYSAWMMFFGQSTSIFSPQEIAAAIALISAYAVVMTQMSVVIALYRATHKFAYAMVFTGSLILLEGLALIVLVNLGAGIAPAAGAFLMIRLVGYFAFQRLLINKEPWVKFGMSRANKATLHSLAGPSAAAFVFTLAGALLLQGTTIALGAVAGAASVAVFVAARTIARVPLQFAGLFLRPSLPELTRAIAEGDTARTAKLNRFNLMIAVVSTLPICFILTVFGPRILVYLSAETLSAPHVLFALLGAGVVANAVWAALSAPLIAENRQSEFAYVYLFLAVAVIGCVYLQGQSHLALVALFVLVVEVVVLGWVLWIREGRKFN